MFCVLGENVLGEIKRVTTHLLPISNSAHAFIEFLSFFQFKGKQGVAIKLERKFHFLHIFVPLIIGDGATHVLRAIRQIPLQIFG